MTVLGIECSAVTASCAVLRDGELLCEAYNATRLTHSQTLMPMLQDMLRNAHLSLSEIDCFAVAAGPGSFTGLRIGIAAVKGIAMALQKPCCAVSTLEAMAYGMPFDGVLVPCMDARCNQTYTAAFRRENGVLTRLFEDVAIPIAELEEKLRAIGEPALLFGDGAELCAAQFADRIPTSLAPAPWRKQRAVGVCLAAEQAPTVDADALAPIYLRLPQAERELKRKTQEQA